MFLSLGLSCPSCLVVVGRRGVLAFHCWSCFLFLSGYVSVSRAFVSVLPRGRRSSWGFSFSLLVMFFVFVWLCFCLSGFRVRLASWSSVGRRGFLAFGSGSCFCLVMLLSLGLPVSSCLVGRWSSWVF